ncbi:hypothetical protein Nepgr_033531 [Nepenthes gracilis]|uniref:Uncharacterized protein n=1 Tax=Nepenthes gracilis TaxID=150966 RepID=A0AAD3TLL8_NEPGR|nr:hypothetical protein Nepgr_033531 [Nepenthes gracilis]
MLWLFGFLADGLFGSLLNVVLHLFDYMCSIAVSLFCTDAVGANADPRLKTCLMFGFADSALSIWKLLIMIFVPYCSSEVDEILMLNRNAVDYREGVLGTAVSSVDDDVIADPTAVFLVDGFCSSLFLWLNKGWQRCIHCSLIVLCFFGWVDVVLNVAPTMLLLCLAARAVQLMELGLGMLPPLFWVSHLSNGCEWGCSAVV